jgi:hypothetical protein
MFGRSKPVEFNPYGSRRSRRRVPPWLLLLLTGIAVGAAGVLVVQDRYLPPRLSATASAALRADFEQADEERTRLRVELESTARRLETVRAEREALAEELTATRETAEHLRADVEALAAALPPDPRGGVVQVRAARFTTDGGQLLYEVVLSRDRTGKPQSGVLQVVVAGAPKGKPETTLKLTPVDITIGPVESVRGELALPDGFDARQATVQVLDRPDGRLLGRRVLHVNPK